MVLIGLEGPPKICIIFARLSSNFEAGFMSGHFAFRGLIELKFIVASTGGHSVIGHLHLPDIQCSKPTCCPSMGCQVKKMSDHPMPASGCNNEL